MVALALLRGINVGGKNVLPMRDLAGIFVEAGCRNVRTFIQSGNVLFDAPTGLSPAIPERIGALIAERFGYRVPVILRSLEEMERAVARSPFVQDGSPEQLFVLFLASQPDAARIASLDPDRSPPDCFVVDQREIYLRLRNGAASSKFTNAYFDSKLGTVSTARNWRTTVKLLEMMRERGD